MFSIQKDYLVQQMRTAEMRENAERQRLANAVLAATGKSRPHWTKSVPWMEWLISTISIVR